VLRTGVRWPVGRAGIRKPPVGLVKGMLNLSGKVRLGKVYSIGNYKDCLNVIVFSQGPLTLTCAIFGGTLAPPHGTLLCRGTPVKMYDYNA